MFARFKNPAAPDAVAALRDMLRFVVVETASAGKESGPYLTLFAPFSPLNLR